VPVAPGGCWSGAPLGAAAGVPCSPLRLLQPELWLGQAPWTAFQDKPLFLLARPLGAVVVAVALATLLGPTLRSPCCSTPELLKNGV